MNEEQQKIYDFANQLYDNYVNTKNSINNINKNPQLNNDINYISKDFKDGFIIAIRTLSSYLFFL